MWRAVTDAVGIEARDALWDYPDFMPDASDIDDPSALIARLEARARGEEEPTDAFDDALAALLAGETPAGPPEGGQEAEDGADDAEAPDEPEDPGPRPV